MRGFDYLIVLFSVLLGLSLSRLLVGLARVVVDPERRVHWLPLLWTIYLFLYQVVVWWLAYQRADQSGWSFAHYLVMMVYPVLLFFQGVLLYPELGPHDEGTLESFLARRKPFFVTSFLLFEMDAVENVLAGEWQFNPVNGAIATLVGGVVYGTAIWTRNRIYHAILVAVMLSIVVASAIRGLPAID